MKKSTVFALPERQRREDQHSGSVVDSLALEMRLARGVLLGIGSKGLLSVRTSGEKEIFCDCLQNSSTALELKVGDAVLIGFTGMPDQLGIILGRIGHYAAPQPHSQVIIEATESLTLKCGEALVNLRADGKVMVKGEDVLIRAKGTQRIRAGNVAIN